MISWSAVIPGSRPSRSRRTWRRGWRPGVWSSTRTRRRIVHLKEGFDFLGFNVRRYRNGKLLIKPSSAAVKRLRRQARRRDAHSARLQRGGGHRRAQPDHPGLGRLLPGQWCPARYSSRWTTTRGSSPTGGHGAPTRGNPKQWVVHRYFGRFNKFRNDRWVFGIRLRDERGSVPHMIKFAWTPIVRHRWSQARRLPTTPTWPPTGPTGDARSNPRWTAITCACSPSRTGAARCAGPPADR